MKIISDFISSQKNAFYWIYKNPIKFFCPIIIGIIIYSFNKLVSWNSNVFFMFIYAFFETNVVLFISSFYILNYCKINLNKINLLKILLCSFINLCLFGFIEYLKWGHNVNEIVLYLLKSGFYTIMTIVILLIIDKQVKIKDVLKKFIGIMVLFIIWILLSIIIYLLLENKLKYNINQNIFNKLIQSIQFIIIIVYTFLLIANIKNSMKQN